eukprot:6214230-Pleurochrysis_carterae.AAC.1
MAVPKSPRAAKASAEAAREGVVPQDPPRPLLGKGLKQRDHPAKTPAANRARDHHCRRPGVHFLMCSTS